MLLAQNISFNEYLPVIADLIFNQIYLPGLSDLLYKILLTNEGINEHFCEIFRLHN